MKTMYTTSLRSFTLGIAVICLTTLTGAQVSVADESPRPDDSPVVALPEGPLPTSRTALETVLAPRGYGEGGARSQQEAQREQEALLPVEAAQSAGDAAGAPSFSRYLAEENHDENTSDVRALTSPSLSLETMHVARAEIRSEVAVLGITFPAGKVPEEATMTYRLLVNGVWQEWEETEVENEMDREVAMVGTDAVLALDASAVEAVVRDTNGEEIVGADLVVTGIDEVDTDTPVRVSEENRNEATPTEDDPSTESEIHTIHGGGMARQVRPMVRPEDTTTYSPGFFDLKIVTRKGLGVPKESDWDLEGITPAGVVIHHTAGNNNYSRAQAAAAVRGVHNYHANTLGWGDVGYHFLIDRYGTVYQGREGSLSGFYEAGHARGANQNTIGVSVVGDFTEAEPPIAAQNSAAKVSAWLLKRMGARDVNARIRVTGSPATGRWIPTLSGHRDVGGTACPGQAFYDKLPRLRQVTANLLAGKNSWIDSNGRVQVATAQTPPPKPKVAGERLSGTSRIDTALALSKHQFDDHSASAVYFVNASAPVDALAAGVVSDGPVLLVGKESVPAAVKAEVERLGASQIVLVGGRKVLSDSLLASFPGRAHVRLGGNDRFATARLLARRAFPAGASQVYIADGIGADLQGSPDAIVAANAEDGPILLSRVGGPLDPATRADITRMRASVVLLGSADLGIAGERLAGQTRYETALASARSAYPGRPSRVYLVRGDVLVDGVAAGVLTDGPRVLTPPTALPTAVCDYLREKKPAKVVAVGGTGAIAESVLDTARECAAQ